MTRIHFSGKMDARRKLPFFPGGCAMVVPVLWKPVALKLARSNVLILVSCSDWLWCAERVHSPSTLGTGNLRRQIAPRAIQLVAQAIIVAIALECLVLDHTHSLRLKSIFG